MAIRNLWCLTWINWSINQTEAQRPNGGIERVRCIRPSANGTRPLRLPPLTAFAVSRWRKPNMLPEETSSVSSAVPADFSHGVFDGEVSGTQQFGEPLRPQHTMVRERGETIGVGKDTPKLRG